MTERTDKRGTRGDEPAADAEDFRVDDRRHWAHDEDEDETEPDNEAGSPAVPTIIDEYRARAEAAEQKLQDYIEAFKSFKSDQEDFRVRLQGDVERKVALQFGELVTQLLEMLDDLDLALTHGQDVAEAEPLVRGIVMARKRFLDTLERRGVERIVPDGQPFDPNEAEAMVMVPVSSPDQHGAVVETLRPGYRLGDRVIRAARVSVGRHTKETD